MSEQKIIIKKLKRKLKKLTKTRSQRTPEELQNYNKNIIFFKQIFKNTRLCKVSVKFLKSGYFLLTLKVKGVIFDKQKLPSFYSRKHYAFKTQR
jgi:lipid-binding SYLF domain-containing protein